MFKEAAISMDTVHINRILSTPFTRSSWLDELAP